MSCGTENVKIEPMEVYLGTDVAQVQTVTCVASSVASNLNSKYFLLYASTGVKYVVWMDVNNTGVDPAIAGYTSVSVELGANPQTAAQVATAVQVAVDPLATFVATVSGSVVTITDAASGAATFAHDSQVAKTGFAFSVSKVGDTFDKVGLIDGDIAISGLARTPVDIKAHQNGATVLGQIFTSAGNPEISFTLKEVTYARIEKISRYANGAFYPVAAASTPGIGGGSGGLFKSPTTPQLVLHPVRLGVADKSNDYCFWKVSLDLDSLNFSGENILMLPVKAKAFEDCDKASAVSVWMYGDWSQSFVK